MTQAAVRVVVCDKEENDYRGTGVYCSDGRLECLVEIDGVPTALEIDPQCYNTKNPRRLMYEDDAGSYRWSRFYLKSMLLETKPAKVPGKRR